MANIRNLKRELASHVRDQAKILKQIETDTLKENLEFVPNIIANDNNLLEVLGEKSKRDLKKIFSDVIKSVEFYNLIKLSVDSLVNSNAEISLNDYATGNAYYDSNNTSEHANYGENDTIDY